jgi:hypothetical protein
VYVDWQNDLVVVRWINQPAFDEFVGEVLAAMPAGGAPVSDRVGA